MFLCLFLCLLGLVVFCFAIFMLTYYEWRSLAFRRRCLKIPHPEMSFIVGIGLELLKCPLDEITDFVERLWKKVGNVFYFSVMGHPNVFLINPEDIETLFNNIKYVRKGDEYLALIPWLGNGLLTSTGDHWHTRRKQLTPSFHFKILETYLPIFNSNANALVEKLAQTGGQPTPIKPVLSSCTLNIICETTMGTSLNLLTNDAKEYADAVRETSNITVNRILTFWWYSNWVFYLSPIGRRYRKCLRKIHDFVDRIIEERRQTTFGRTVDEEKKILAGTRTNTILVYDMNNTPLYIAQPDGMNQKIKANREACANFKGMYKQRRSFLDHLLSIQRENPASLSDNDIRDEVNTFMFEGHDTIAAALTWTLFMLANHPEVQDRARDEVNEVFPFDDYDSISMEDLSKLQYLDMVLKETMRLYPSVPYITRRIPHDMKIGEYVLPAEMNVLVMPYLVHRNPAVYADPDKFDPERFAPDMAKTYHPYAYLPFSAGYRNCIGQRFAMMEGKIVLAHILKKFRISSMQKREDIKTAISIVLCPSPEINLSFTPTTCVPGP